MTDKNDYSINETTHTCDLLVLIEFLEAYYLAHETSLESKTKDVIYNMLDICHTNKKTTTPQSRMRSVLFVTLTTSSKGEELHALLEEVKEHILECFGWRN